MPTTSPGSRGRGLSVQRVAPNLNDVGIEGVNARIADIQSRIIAMQTQQATTTAQASTAASTTAADGPTFANYLSDAVATQSTRTYKLNGAGVPDRPRRVRQRPDPRHRPGTGRRHRAQAVGAGRRVADPAHRRRQAGRRDDRHHRLVPVVRRTGRPGPAQGAVLAGRSRGQARHQRARLGHGGGPRPERQGAVVDARERRPSTGSWRTCRASPGTGPTSRRPDPAPRRRLPVADQLAVQDRQPAVRVGGPGAPAVRDPLQILRSSPRRCASAALAMSDARIRSAHMPPHHAPVLRRRRNTRCSRSRSRR